MGPDTWALRFGFRLGQESQLPRPDHGLGSATDSELVVNLLHVPFHRALGEPQPITNLAVAQAAADEGKNIDLSAGQTTAKAISVPIILCFQRWPATHQRNKMSGKAVGGRLKHRRSEEHTSELQSLMRISYAVFCLKTKKRTK